MPVMLSIDVGTSKLCAMAYDARRRRVLVSRTAPNDADLPAGRIGWHEQSPRRIAANCMALVRAVAGALGPAAQRVAGIALTGQMHGVLLATRHCQPLTPLITWRDRRTLPAPGAGQTWQAGLLPAGDARGLGCDLRPGYGGATLHWLAARKSIPDNAVALSIADYVAAVLTGIMATGRGMAASWGIFDLRRQQWCQALVGKLRIPAACLPPVLPDALSLGVAAAKMCGRLGVPPQTQVFVPIGDNQASVIGAGGSDLNTAVINLGTGGQISIPIRRFRRAPGLETRPMPFGGYLLVGASLCGGWAWAYFCRFMRMAVREMTGEIISDADVFQRANRLALKAAPDADGLTADTRFAGSHAQPQKLGGIFNISHANLTPANMARAIAEGMVRELAELGRAGMHDGIRKLAISGNAARKNTVFPKVAAEIFQRPCHVARQSEAAALGAARCALRALDARL